MSARKLKVELTAAEADALFSLASMACNDPDTFTTYFLGQSGRALIRATDKLARAEVVGMTRLHAALYALFALYCALYLVACAFRVQAVITPMAYAAVPLWLGGTCLAYYVDNVR